MGKYATGKFAQRISDRDGMAYPYSEMVQEWNGLWVHYSEFEPKAPQINPKNHPTDFEALQHAMPQVANSTVYVGRIGTNVNSFETLQEAVTLYYANGVSYPGFVRSMQPLSVQQPNKPTLLHSFVGKVTVTTT